jgi:glutamate carboxypeptidase
VTDKSALTAAHALRGTQLRAAAEAKRAWTLTRLRSLVEIESPWADKKATNRIMDYLAIEVEARGASVRRIPQSHHADVLVAYFHGSAEGRPLLVMTHLDTVWPLGTVASRPWRIDGDRVYGPGVYDMKAGTAMMFAALDLIAAGDLRGRSLVWWMNGDEEPGTVESRPYLEELAQDVEVALCLAKQIVWLQTLADVDLGTTINVGTLRGGIDRVVVAPSAHAEIDLRVATMAEAERVVPLILGARPIDRRANVRVSGRLNKPPMERTVANQAAFERAKVLGALVGVSVTEGATGGGSDGNFTSALGVATIDGLGCPGGGAHSDSEHILMSRLGERTALLSALLAWL